MKLFRHALPEKTYNKCIMELNDYNLRNRVWASSTLEWESNLISGVVGSTLTSAVSKELSEELEKDLKPHLPPYNRVTFTFYLWQTYSGINWHNDEGYRFGATLYLCELGYDWGGLFMWRDEESRESGIIKSIRPKENLLVLNDEREHHSVSTVLPNPRNIRRYTLQIRGH